MRNKKFAALCLCAVFALSGCSRTAAQEQPTESFTYNGTFDEAVFDQVCRDVTIGERHVTLPCTLNDLGKGFKAEHKYTSDFYKQAIYTLTYHDADLCTISYYSDHELDGKALKNAQIASFYISQNAHREEEISIGGITPGKHVSVLEEQFGEPTRKTEPTAGDTGTTQQEYLYLVGDADPDYFGNQKILSFTLVDNNVFAVSIQMPTPDYSQD